MTDSVKPMTHRFEKLDALRAQGAREIERMGGTPAPSCGAYYDELTGIIKDAYARLLALETAPRLTREGVELIKSLAKTWALLKGESGDAARAFLASLTKPDPQPASSAASEEWPKWAIRHEPGVIKVARFTGDGEGDWLERYDDGRIVDHGFSYSLSRYGCNWLSTTMQEVVRMIPTLHEFWPRLVPAPPASEEPVSAYQIGKLLADRDKWKAEAERLQSELTALRAKVVPEGYAKLRGQWLRKIQPGDAWPGHCYLYVASAPPPGAAK